MGENRDVDFKNNDFHQRSCFDMIKHGQAESFCLMMRLQPSQLAENSFWNRNLKKSDFYFPHLNKVLLVNPNRISSDNVISVFGEKAVLSGNKYHESEVSGESNQEPHSTSLTSKPSEISQVLNSLGKNTMEQSSKQTLVSNSNLYSL